MKVHHDEAPRLSDRLDYIPVPKPNFPMPPPPPRPAFAQAAFPAPSPSPARRLSSDQSPIKVSSPLARLTTPPIYPRTPPRTPLEMVGLDSDIYPTRSPPKRLPALTESTSAPLLARTAPTRPARTAEAHPSGVIDQFRADSIHPYLEGSMTLTKKNRKLEAKLAEANELLSKERKGRHAREERRAAEEEVARKLLQERFEEEIRRVKAECEQKLTEAGLSSASNDAQIAELEKSYKAQADAREAADRKARIDMLRRQVGRRMLNRGLSLGFTAWSEL